jgi:branched-chain amino acid transport system substrate-binding protein
MTALIKALNEVDGEVADQKPLQAALAKTTLSGDEAPWGGVTLDGNRQAISNVFLKKIVDDTTGDGVPDVQTFARVPDVEQTFGGFFTEDAPAPDRENPECKSGGAPPWVGKSETVSFAK